MRKTIMFSIIFLFVLINVFAQTIPGLELHLKPKTTDLKLYQELWIEAYLFNNSTQTIKMFQVGRGEPGWNGYQKKWEGTINENPMVFSFFSDGVTERFRSTIMVDVLPGDSIYAGLLRYKLEAAGNYKIMYTLSADPALVKTKFAADANAVKEANKITKFSVTTNPFEISIEDVAIGEIEQIEISADELEKKGWIYDLEKAFNDPSNVFKLTVSGNVTKEVMLKVCSLKNLKILSLNRISGIEELPDELEQLDLVELIINDIGDIKLSESLGNLKSLKRISVKYMSITEFPTFIMKLSNLEIINISHCPITSVPDEIVNLKNLKELIFESVNISTLNPKISNVISLEKLTVSKSLTSFPEVFGCENLKHLYLVYNKGITVVPPEIGQLKQLESIDLAIAGISSIPKEISELKKLKVFNFSNNKITEIPAELYECTSLEKIDLSNNQISVVAPGIDKLSNLVEFVAYKNNISALPVGLSNCPKIERVWVHTNNIKAGDQEGEVLEVKLGKKYKYKK